MAKGSAGARASPGLALAAVAALAAVLLVSRAPQPEVLQQLKDSFMQEDLAAVREFLRHPTLAKARAGAVEFWEIIGPGGRLHPGWFLEHKGHIVIEGLLMVIIVVMLLQSRFYPRTTEDEDALTDKVGCCWRLRRHVLLLLCRACCCESTAVQHRLASIWMLPARPAASLHGAARQLAVIRHPALQLAVSAACHLLSAAHARYSCSSYMLAASNLSSICKASPCGAMACRRLTPCARSGSRSLWCQTSVRRTTGQSRPWCRGEHRSSSSSRASNSRASSSRPSRSRASSSFSSCSPSHSTCSASRVAEE